MSKTIHYFPTIDAVKAAARNLEGISNVTPLIHNPQYSSMFDCNLSFKREDLQVVRSYKIRGAYNKMSSLTSAEKENGVVCASAGNHAQGVAAAAAYFGVPATIIMPADAPQIKITNTKTLGARVVLYDRNTEDREAIGLKLAHEHNLTLVPPYDDADIIAGQGTVGLEAANQFEALGLVPDQAIGPIGGGGLMSGTATALKYHFPNINIWGAEPEGHDDAARSIGVGHRLANKNAPSSICDAIVTPMVGKLTFPIIQRYLDGAKAVDDQQVLVSMARCMPVSYTHLRAHET